MSIYRSDPALFARTSEKQVRECLSVLYTRMKEDRMVGFLFEGKPLEAIVEGQVHLVCAVLGAPGFASYQGRSLPEAHRELPLLPGHFDRRHELLREALAEVGVDEKVNAAWLEADTAWRRAILNSGEFARERARSAQDYVAGASDAPSASPSPSASSKAPPTGK